MDWKFYIVDPKTEALNLMFDKNDDRRLGWGYGDGYGDGCGNVEEGR